MRILPFLFLGVLFLIGCKSTYKTVDFKSDSVPKTPDYSNDKSWAVLPGKYPQELLKIVKDQEIKKTDVFFIYPTLLTDKKDTNWNADIEDFNIRKQVLDGPIAYQSSAWAAAGNIYAPYYRQTHYRIFVEPYESQGLGAWELAYNDVRNAFIYYLEHYNQGKPIIIASHSQGSFHGKRLMKEFFDGKPLQKQLVAAYLVGAKIKPDEFQEISHLEVPNAVGGFVSWNTYKRNKTPKNYDNWYKGGVTSNPITWDGAQEGNEALHKGVLYQDGKLYPKSLSVEIIDGLLWSSLPKVPKRFLLSFINNYHFADVNLFWGDIQENAILRVSQWFIENKNNF